MRAAFTLVELILVMAILAIVMALSAPALSRSMRERALEQETARLHALTLFARNEAVSEGAAMAIWIDPSRQRYGMQPASDYGGQVIHRDYSINPDIQVELIGERNVRADRRAMEFTPGGLPSLNSAEAIRLSDRTGASRLISRREDGAGYEIIEEVTK